MEIWNKICLYLKNNGHVFICWGIFVLTVVILSSLVAKWIISTEDTAIRSKNAISCDTIYVIVKPELDELRIKSYSENKDSVWVAPLNGRGYIKKRK
jgi:hypothetical protein